MLSKTLGIVIKKIAYSDNSAVVTIYTREYGKIAFLVRGLNSKKNSNAYYQPGTILALVIYNNPKKNLKTIKEISAVLHSIPSHPIYNLISQIMVEIIDKTTPEEQAEPAIYDLCEQYLQQLSTQYSAYYLHKFCNTYLEQLGNAIHRLGTINTGITAAYEGMNLPSKIIQFTNTDLKNINLITVNKTPNLDRSQRNLLLKKLIGFIELHLTNDKRINSIKVAEQLL